MTTSGDRFWTNGEDSVASVPQGAFLPVHPHAVGQLPPQLDLLLADEEQVLGLDANPYCRLWNFSTLNYEILSSSSPPPFHE